MNRDKANAISDECMERLNGILDLKFSHLTTVFIKSLFEYAYRHGNADGFREALDIAHEGDRRHA